MKSIAREKLGSAKLHENLKSEISIMRDFNHPNIVRLYESFVSINVNFTILLNSQQYRIVRDIYI